jgi:hypothetical protein
MASTSILPAPLPGRQADSLARGLGWFSLALGVAEVLAPGALARWLGMKGTEPILTAYGIREISTGIGILASKEPAGWVWGRVLGDGLDIATLAAGFTDQNPKKQNAGLALAAVVGVTLADIACARSLSRNEARDRTEHRQDMLRSYRRRSGFRRPAEAMRGTACDFNIPADMRTPEALRPFRSA